MAWQAHFWPWSGELAGAIYTIAALIAATIAIRCIWLRSWVPLAFCVGYALMVVLAINWITVRTANNSHLNGSVPRVSYVARRAMPPNRRLVDDDFERPRDLPMGYFWYLPDKRELEGHYLSQNVAAQGAIDATTLLVVPKLSAAGILVPIVPVELRSSLNATATIMLCAADNDCLPGVITVEAIVCAPKQAQCYAALAPLNAEQKAVSKANTPNSKYKTIVPVTLP